jgi:hypothetical protein
MAETDDPLNETRCFRVRPGHTLLNGDGSCRGRAGAVVECSIRELAGQAYKVEPVEQAPDAPAIESEPEGEYEDRMVRPKKRASRKKAEDDSE